MHRKTATSPVMRWENRRAPAQIGALRLHSVAVGAPLHRSHGPAQRKGLSVIEPHVGDGARSAVVLLGEMASK
jgi:hypothetical protein